MRYRLAALCLAAMLGVLPSLTHIPAAPLPEKAKPPDVYALVYVGLGKNDRRNDDRIKYETNVLRSRGAGDEEKSKAVVEKIGGRMNAEEWNKWFNTKRRVETLDGAPVLRVSFTHGTPEEQAIIVNSVIRYYLKDVERRRKGLRRWLQIAKNNYPQVDAAEKARLDKVIPQTQEEEENLPRLLEWAAVKSGR